VCVWRVAADVLGVKQISLRVARSQAASCANTLQRANTNASRPTVTVATRRRVRIDDRLSWEAKRRPDHRIMYGAGLCRNTYYRYVSTSCRSNFVKLQFRSVSTDIRALKFLFPGEEKTWVQWHYAYRCSEMVFSLLSADRLVAWLLM
jgi:hypothetical protein